MTDPVLGVVELGSPPWPTLDPFLFCVHHRDHYPAGNEAMGLERAQLGGRNIGSDFSAREGWSMYHGDVVPGFPRHPHRGFETVTLARSGFIDHSDSLGATARFGNGDVQWMTAGGGVQHSEMFPLVEREGRNPTELFQLWMNLPAEDKGVPAYFTMLWKETIPVVHVADEDGNQVEVVVIAGDFGPAAGPPPPPNSWASRDEAQVAIWTIKLPPNARFTLPAAGNSEPNRALYFFEGQSLRVAGQKFAKGVRIQVDAGQDLELRNGPQEAELLMLQGRPIGEPVVHYGPFVMNTEAEIHQTIREYKHSGFGGWPWSRNDPVHARDQGRFAIHADGKREEPKVG